MKIDTEKSYHGYGVQFDWRNSDASDPLSPCEHRRHRCRCEDQECKKLLLSAESLLVSRTCELNYSTTDWTMFSISWHETATERDRLLVCETIVSVEDIDPTDAVETWLDRLSLEQIRSKFLPCTYDDRRFFVALGRWIRVACGETAEIEGDE